MEVLELLLLEIIKILHQENNFVEYLAKQIGSTSSNRRIKEYAMQVVGLSPKELKNREDKIKNQYNALKNIKGKPFILNVDFRIDEENHLFYEISDLMDENSLRSESRIKTFTLKEKVDTTNVTTLFPTDNDIANQFKLVTRLMQTRESRGSKRDIFYVQDGGYDTHGEFTKYRLVTTIQI